MSNEEHWSATYKEENGQNDDSTHIDFWDKELDEKIDSLFDMARYEETMHDTTDPMAFSTDPLVHMFAQVPNVLCSNFHLDTELNYEHDASMDTFDGELNSGVVKGEFSTCVQELDLCNSEKNIVWGTKYDEEAEAYIGVSCIDIVHEDN